MDKEVNSYLFEKDNNWFIAFPITEIIEDGENIKVNFDLLDAVNFFSSNASTSKKVITEGGLSINKSTLSSNQ